MSFEVEIRVEAPQAKQTIAGVGTELAKVEAAAGKARDSMGRFAKGAQDGAERAKQSTQGFAGSLSQLSSAFAGVTAALQREADVLERIRGPMREHRADMMALDSMYRRGAISAREYRTEVERMNRAVGATPTAPASSGLGSAVLNGAGLGFVAGGAAGIAQAGTQAVMGSVRAIGDLADSYTNLSNRIARAAKTEEQHTLLMERTKTIANATRADWAATGESYVRLRNATRDLGLTQERTLRLTETIGKAFSMSGASTSEASAAMLQLTQAFASGRLQGDEFRSLSESLPDVLDLVAKEMNVSRGQLKELGSEGKITSDVLVRAFENARTQIDSGFAKTAPTLTGQWQVFKNEMTQVFGEFVRDSNALPQLGAMLTKLAKSIGQVVDLMGKLKDMGGFDKMLGDGATFDILTGSIVTRVQDLFGGDDDEGLTDLQLQLQGVASALELVDSIPRRGMMSGSADPWGFRAATLGASTFDEVLQAHMRTLKLMGGEIDALGAAQMVVFNETLKRVAADGLATFNIFGQSIVDTFGFAIPNAIDATLGKLGGPLQQAIGDLARKALGVDGTWRTEGDVKAGMGKRSAARRAAPDAKPRDSWSEAYIPPWLEQLSVMLSAGKDLTNRLNAELEQTNATMAALGQTTQTAVTGWFSQLAANLEHARKEFTPLQLAFDQFRSQVTNDAAHIGGAFSSVYGTIDEALQRLVTNQKVGWKELVNSILGDLARLSRQLLMSQLFKMFSGSLGTGKEAQGFANALGQGFGSAAGSVGTGLGALFGGGFASGGTWRAPIGSGGPDSIPVMFRVSPGERVDFTPQGQAQQSGGRPIVIQNYVDGRQIAEQVLDSPEGERAIMNVIKRQAGAIRSISGKP